MRCRVGGNEAWAALAAGPGGLDWPEQAVESHARTSSMGVVWLEQCGGEVRPCWRDPVSQNVPFSCRCCSQQPACCSSWMFGRTAVTSFSLSCIPPIAWASVRLQMCTPAPTFCSRPMLMQVMGTGLPHLLQPCGLNNLASCGHLKDCEKCTLLRSSYNSVSVTRHRWEDR